MLEKTYKVVSKTGIQARPAAQLVNLASQFEADITLNYESAVVNLKSIMGVMSLAVGKDAIFKITINGRDEQQASERIHDFIKTEIAEIA